MMLHLHDFQLNLSATFHISTQHADGLQSLYTIGIWSMVIGSVAAAAAAESVDGCHKGYNHNHILSHA